MRPAGPERPTIGFQITNLYDEYPIPLLAGVSDTVRSRGFNLLVLLSETPNSPHAFLYQSNVVYDHVRRSNVEALIVSSGSVSNFLSPHQFRSFFDRFEAMRLVSIGAEIPHGPSVLVDNEGGVREIVRHLVECHGRKKIAFFHGPRANPEAQTRYRAFRGTLQELGIPFDTRRLAFGDFEEPSGERSVADLCGRGIRFDAVVASNDNMAYGAMRELQSRGIRVPEDVSVCGFDGFAVSRFSVPPLTTVQQPFYEQGRRAAELAIDLIAGAEVPDTVTLPARPVIRTSCGCTSEALRVLTMSRSPDADTDAVAPFAVFSGPEVNSLLVAATESGDSFLGRLAEVLRAAVIRNAPLDAQPEILPGIRAAVEDHLSLRDAPAETRRIWLEVFPKAQILISESGRLQQASRRHTLEDQAFRTRESMQRMTSTLHMDELMALLRVELPRFGIGCGYVVTYERPIRHTRSDTWTPPPRAILHLAFDTRESFPSTPREPLEFDTRHIVPPEYLPQHRHYELVLHPLYFMEEQLGYIVMELGDIGKGIYETLASQVSSAVKSIQLFQAKSATEKQLRETLSRLETYNRSLTTLSQKDELTGLYNRRGFQIVAEQQLSLCRSGGRPGLLFYFDMDGLKEINDAYGHDEGDAAISALAEILRSVFRAGDPLARLGGDEFTAFTMNTPTQSAEMLCARLQDHLDRHNEHSDKPYSLSVSIGYAPSSTGDEGASADSEIDELLRTADRKMYSGKRAKKRTGRGSSR